MMSVKFRISNQFLKSVPFSWQHVLQLNTDETDFYRFAMKVLSVLIRSIRVNPRAILCLHNGGEMRHD